MRRPMIFQNIRNVWLSKKNAPPPPTDLSLQQIPLSGQGVHNIARNIKRPKCLGTYSERK